MTFFLKISVEILLKRCKASLSIQEVYKGNQTRKSWKKQRKHPKTPNIQDTQISGDDLFINIYTYKYIGINMAEVSPISHTIVQYFFFDRCNSAIFYRSKPFNLNYKNKDGHILYLDWISGAKKMAFQLWTKEVWSAFYENNDQIYIFLLDVSDTRCS
jgi:hypothetical protein